MGREANAPDDRRWRARERQMNDIGPRERAYIRRPDATLRVPVLNLLRQLDAADDEPPMPGTEPGCETCPACRALVPAGVLH